MRGCENPGRKDPPGGKVSDATAGQLHEQVPCPGLGWGLVCIRYCQGVSKGWRSGVGGLCCQVFRTILSGRAELLSRGGGCETWGGMKTLQEAEQVSQNAEAG